MHADAHPPYVGPILIAGPAADAIIAALHLHNREVVVTERGAYVRVACPGRCILHRAALAATLGHDVDLRRELELNMPSFQGKLALGPDEARWETLH